MKIAILADIHGNLDALNAVLAQAVSIPVYGKVADLLGRKNVMLVGVGLFVVGSLLCGVAWSMGALVAFRAVQGLGAGAIQPIGMTIIGDIYTVAEFRERLERLDPASSQVVIDISDVTLLDSSGLGALVSLLNQARHGGRGIGIVCPQRRLRRVFEITGLRRAFVFGDDLDAVRRGLAAAAE